ncbi:MAG TPA: TrmH family RNA methyltransferase [Gaiellaceae bacterium]
MPRRIDRIRTANDEFQLAQALLTNRRQRQRQRRFVVEGVRPINRLVEAGWPVDSIWFPAERRLSAWAGALLEATDVHVEVEPSLFAALSGKEEPSEVLVLAELPTDDLARIRPGGDALLVAFDRPVSPGNLGSVIRSLDAFGGDGLVVTGHAADPYDPQSVRASMGSLFAVPTVRADSLDAVAEWLDTLRPALQVVATSVHAEAALEALDLTRPTLLALGNETRGLGQGWRELCDTVVRIPQRGGADSLNVAAAAAIALYEADRQRRAAGNPPGNGA